MIVSAPWLLCDGASSALQVQHGKSVVKRLLLIVLLLDRAASTGNLADQAPLLFLPEATSKSSAQVRIHKLAFYDLHAACAAVQSILRP